MAVIFWSQNCGWGSMVPPFQHVGEPFWHLAPWATQQQGHVGFQNRICGDFGMISAPHPCCEFFSFVVGFHVALTLIFESSSRHLRLLKHNFRIEMIPKTHFRRSRYFLLFRGRFLMFFGRHEMNLNDCWCHGLAQNCLIFQGCPGVGPRLPEIQRWRKVGANEGVLGPTN